MATPTEWADKHRQRAADARSAQASAASSGSAEDWLSESRWKLAAAVTLTVCAGPGALGYATVLVLAYLVYTRLYLTGTTPAALWEDYTAAAMALSQKKRKKAKTKK
jgi:hypothetical protein